MGIKTMKLYVTLSNVAYNKELRLTYSKLGNNSKHLATKEKIKIKKKNPQKTPTI